MKKVDILVEKSKTGYPILWETGRAKNTQNGYGRIIANDRGYAKVPIFVPKSTNGQIGHAAFVAEVNDLIVECYRENGEDNVKVLRITGIENVEKNRFYAVLNIEEITTEKMDKNSPVFFAIMKARQKARFLHCRRVVYGKFAKKNNEHKAEEIEENTENEE